MASNRKTTVCTVQALDGTALPVAEGILRIPRAEIEALTADAIHEITVILHA